MFSPVVWSWLPPPGLTSPVWSPGRFWLLGAGSRPVCPLRHILAFVRCELVSPLFPRLLRRALAYGLRSGLCRSPAGLASMDRPLLVSSVESQLCERPFMVLPRQLVGSGVYSPASPFCPTSSVLRRSSFGISASVFASSLRDGVTLPGRVCLSPRSERRLFLHLPGVWLESSRWGHPVGSILSQISIGTKTLCAPSLVVAPSLRDGVTRFGSCGAFLRTQSERRLLPFIYPSLLRDGVTLRVVCVFSHSIVTKSTRDS